MFFQENLSQMCSGLTYEDSFIDHGNAWDNTMMTLEDQRNYMIDAEMQEIKNRTNMDQVYWQKHPENFKMVTADVLHRRNMEAEARKMIGDKR
jgi:hypothetical protein